MSNIVQNSWFNGMFMLPNRDILKPEGQELSTFIGIYEKEYLQRVLGYELAKDLMAYTGAPSNAAYDNLLNGAEFVHNDKTHKWDGFANSQRSPITAYVYTKVQAFRDTSTVGIGEQMLETENGIRTNAGAKIVQALIFMVDSNYMLNAFLHANKDVPEYESYIGFYSEIDEDMYTYPNRFNL